MVNSQALICVVFAFVLTVAWTSLVHGSITCDESIPASCRDAGLSGTHFPNDFGHLNASAAEAALTETFGSNNPTNSCSIELGLFACLLYFPDCRFNNATGENVVRRPCRDYCERLQNECVDVAGVATVSCDSFSFWDPVMPTQCYDPFHLIIINEVDIANNSNSFVELWDYGMGDTLLKQYAVIIGENNGGLRDSFNLDGRSTRPNGYFLIGEEGAGIPVDQVGMVEFPSDAGFVLIYRGNLSRFLASAGSSIETMGDGVVYQTEQEFVVSEFLLIFFALQESLLDSADQSGSISRCTSFQPFTSMAFRFVSSTPGVSNACPQKHFETKITVKVIDVYDCCVGAFVFCAFNILNENANDGYCQNRNLWKGQSSPSHVTAMTLRSASCSTSPETLATIQPLIEQNILLESCPIASIERSNVTLISKSDEGLNYSSVERRSADKSPNCNASADECEIFLVSNLINNSTSQVSVEAKCDGANVIGFTIGYECLGTSEFPCTTGKPWKIVARPAGLVNVVILCPNTPGCQNISGGNTATLDAPNQTIEYSFNAKPLPDRSTFNLFVEFTVELFYNDDLKVTIDVAVLEENANIYRAFTVVPSHGLYEVLNEYQFE